MSRRDPAAEALALPVPRALLRLALPILASQALRLAFQWVDALWVRPLGVGATAAITTSIFVMWWVLSLQDVFGMGISAYVSQLMGAGDRPRAGVAAWKGLEASAALGLAGTALGLFGARTIFRLMDPTGRLVEEGSAYLRVVLCAAPLHMMALSCEGVLRACGDTRTPFFVDLAAVTLNALLAPLLIYGVGPFPRLGVAGAGWATACAQAAMLACYGALALRRHPALPLARRAPGPPVRVLGLARVGLPAALIGMLFSLVYVAFVRSASAYGPAAVAVVGIANRIEAIQFIISVALGLAGASLVGQSLGAGRPDRAREVIRTGQRWALAFALVFGACFFAFPGAFLAMFTRDPGAFAVGVPYLRVLALTVPFTALEIVTAEAAMGSGHTRAISWIFTLVSVARIPLAFVVPRWTHSGALGISWLITISCMLRTVAILAWVARGSWQRGLADELRGRAVEAEPGKSS